MRNPRYDTTNKLNSAKGQSKVAVLLSVIGALSAFGPILTSPASDVKAPNLPYEEGQSHFQVSLTSMVLAPELLTFPAIQTPRVTETETACCLHDYNYGRNVPIGYTQDFWFSDHLSFAR
jgi:hypothetical protein